MAESFVGLFIGFFSIFTSAPYGEHASRSIRGEEVAVQWSCSPEVWAPNSGMVNDQFVGTVSATCEFNANHGGGFVQLNKHLNERVVSSPEVEKVHSGPKVETYEGMKSTFFDITTRMGGGSDMARVRADYHIASNDKSRLVFANLSTQVDGSGNAKYVKKTDIVAEVLPKKNKRNFYTMKIKAHAILDRPWYLPAATFENMIREQVKAEAQKTEEALILEAADNL